MVQADGHSAGASCPLLNQAVREDLCEKASVKPFGFHAVRHHVASVTADSGKASMRQVQGVLRHRRRATTEKYLHLLDRGVSEALGLLDEQSGTDGTLVKKSKNVKEAS